MGEHQLPCLLEVRCVGGSHRLQRFVPLAAGEEQQTSLFENVLALVEQPDGVNAVVGVMVPVHINCSSNTIHPGVKPESFLAMVKAAKKYGRYR